ncbi:ATP-dependent endonuclease [Streptomyces ficellus]|uniref:ATP-dependent endonuclease n=1 Tax=Streptomyces ficellus TaxID=1977088 RepID=A0ABT7Z1J3_9ACTN|nr:ATP-dependent endonuclease [Streptomyces ficellus]MDN3293362.1 ATP-dependent endonuclease [Streptomyces ficellus]
MNDARRFRSAVVAWAAAGGAARAAAADARELAARTRPKKVVLVEGHSDRVAVEALAARLGRDLDAEGFPVVPLGGVTSIGRFLEVLGPQGLALDVAGLCDAPEERWFQRGLERAGLGATLGRADMERRGFHVCMADLEDELIRAVGTDTVRHVIAAEGEWRAFHTFQRQPAQRERTVEQQLHRFMGTHSGRKAQYARLLVQRLDPAGIPRPLARLLADTAV